MSDIPPLSREFYTKRQIATELGIPYVLCNRFFKKPTRRQDPERKGHFIVGFSRSRVEAILMDPGFRAQMEAHQEACRQQQEKEALEKSIREYLMTFGISRLQKTARSLSRHFVLHIGPTNSGKTHDSMEALKAAETGAYLGPLRLLALEMYDNLNRDGIPCRLLTGEESIDMPGARHVASTIELADFTASYDVAVIDEVQMIADPFRGDRWLRAIFCIQAREVHLCLAPEARELVCSLLDSFDASFSIVEHQRLAPLVFSGTFRDLSSVRPGDALIAFSRRAVLALSAELSQKNIRASVIYGALPPVSRREEVRRFTEHETSVVVATDAIGMGISLPIRRILFCETTKFDGVRTRLLQPVEIKQIAGRAGRYGIYNKGYVLTMDNAKLVKNALSCEVPQLGRLILPFPEEALSSEYPLNLLLSVWNQLPREYGILRTDMSDSLKLYQALGRLTRTMGKREIYDFITCPVDVDNPELVEYWRSCVLALHCGDAVPEPTVGDETLDACETRYRMLDIRHQLLRRVGIEEGRMEEKLVLCRKINEYLKQNSRQYLRRCRDCGRLLPATYPYRICEKCYRRKYIDDDPFSF